ncbi:ATP-binding protein [Streptomyces sp. MBT62]|uniref:ATP-binding protein n=1 Tax=Streptomyces sp. MBT62 TaxID=2800410 RepID=UPI00190B231F|nr:ATP-binding protein [Streptomyces sp. MBT62]MBK3568272.1 ATP-binding protein [Streptomyces sp. MBT62]
MGELRRSMSAFRSAAAPGTHNTPNGGCFVSSADVTAVAATTSADDVRLPAPRLTPLVMCLDRTLSEVRVVRRLVRPWLTHACHMPEDRVDSVVLVLSELVTNAVEHGTHSSVLFRAESPGNGWVRVDIDNSTPAAIPAPALAPDNSLAGRGLWIVKKCVVELGGKWGYSADGSIAWCEVPIHQLPQPKEQP